MAKIEQEEKEEHERKKREAEKKKHEIEVAEAMAKKRREEDVDDSKMVRRLGRSRRLPHWACPPLPLCLVSGLIECRSNSNFMKEMLYMFVKIYHENWLLDVLLQGELWRQEMKLILGCKALFLFARSSLYVGFFLLFWIASLKITS